jgi:bifunctional non-homologous end joining protein LigD
MQIELPEYPPVALKQRRDAFNSPDWLFEIKHDGFRGMAYIAEGKCRLLSRNLHSFRGFMPLRSALAQQLRVQSAILDGEIVSMDAKGHADFNALLNRKGHICYFAFDLLLLNGKDLRSLPLLERKRKLKALLPPDSADLFYTDHIIGQGKPLFHMVLENDLEGMVAKEKNGAYSTATRWYKIKNPRYSQAEGRKEQFESFYEK